MKASCISLLIVLAVLSQNSMAGIIAYDIIFEAEESVPPGYPEGRTVFGTGYMAFDSDAGTLTSMSFSSDIYSDSWTGTYSVGVYPSPGNCCFRAPAIWVRDMRVFITLDIWGSSYSNASPLGQLESASEAKMRIAGHYYTRAGGINFTRVTPAAVPEPSTLALLSIGLLSFAAKRRVS
jgi:hypothetical protein